MSGYDTKSLAWFKATVIQLNLQRKPNGQSRETDYMLYTDNLEKLTICGTQDQEEQSNNTTQSVGHQCAETNTNNVNKILALLLTTGGKDEPNIISCRNRDGHHKSELTFDL